ncbi:TetR/AcrR family transcriptional regulator C-terminal domain-containing protein [Georgenia sp. Z1491]|uniref:TetR/AcrR family transcriptional regulator C-terminal domain-containing protein n=1 Tax=Georgenia sp. Z1491 TaxID=3416707 RepID=UPI003CF4E546
MLDTAVAIADSDGTEGVTLRAVAARARVPLLRVQREVGSRDRLVAAMVQRVLAARTMGEAQDPVPGSVLRRLGLDEWTAYRRHPWLVPVLASTRPPLVPAVLAAARSAVEAFRSLGLGAEVSRDRYVSFSAYIQGMGLLLVAEQQETRRSFASLEGWWDGEVRRLDRTGVARRHPWLTELSDAPARALDLDAAFRDGLDRVVRGLTALD